MLYVVGTPIGNLDDITLRALEALKSADVIAAEDTRHSGNLLRYFEIRKPLLSYHEHNEAMRTAELSERLAAGETVALISDAGMPLPETSPRARPDSGPEGYRSITARTRPPSTSPATAHPRADDDMFRVVVHPP